MNRGRGAFALTVVACAWLVFLVPASALIPSGSEQTSYSSGTSSTTLVESDGAWVLALMAIPAVLGLIAWIGLHRRCRGGARRSGLLVWVPVGLLCAFSLVGGFSVGLLVLPAAVTLGLAAAITPRGHAPL